MILVPRFTSVLYVSCEMNTMEHFSILFEFIGLLFLFIPIMAALLNLLYVIFDRIMELPHNFKNKIPQIFLGFVSALELK